jgi:hypothetical protein
MSEAILLTALGVVALILLSMFIALRDSQASGVYALQIVLIGFLLGIIVLIGKVGVESYDHCSWVVNNSTTVGNTTSYGYDRVCEINTNNTATSFYKVTLWIMRLVSAYLILVFAFETIQYFGGEKKKKIEGDND